MLDRVEHQSFKLKIVDTLCFNHDKNIKMDMYCMNTFHHSINECLMDRCASTAPLHCTQDQRVGGGLIARVDSPNRRICIKETYQLECLVFHDDKVSDIESMV